MRGVHEFGINAGKHIKNPYSVSAIEVPRAQILHKKIRWKELNNILFCLQNFETEINFFLMSCAHKTWWRVKILEILGREAEPVRVMGILLPLPTCVGDGYTITIAHSDTFIASVVMICEFIIHFFKTDWRASCSYGSMISLQSGPRPLRTLTINSASLIEDPTATNSSARDRIWCR